MRLVLPGFKNMSLEDRKPKSFAQRFRSVALTYGLPLWILDILGNEHRTITVALMHLPFAILGAFIYTVLEGWIGGWLRSDKS